MSGQSVMVAMRAITGRLSLSRMHACCTFLHSTNFHYMIFLDHIAIAAPPASLMLAIAPMGRGNAAMGNPDGDLRVGGCRKPTAYVARVEQPRISASTMSTSTNGLRSAATREMLATRAVAMSETPKKFALAPIAVGPATAIHGLSAHLRRLPASVRTKPWQTRPPLEIPLSEMHKHYPHV
jgi:hypothetical protein